ncbi:MAG: MerR family transcriptional regulator [Lentisphaeria bacterium]|nr:MerR family transcriptional regulator [Lentisphaeria bacterium]
MSNDKISFLTSDLAVALGVPRTTVNDWLTRYAAYLEYEMRGKRRVYTLRSLEVLQFVAGLRAQGMSAPEVEKQLEERYGLRPEIATGELEPPVAGAVAEGDTQLVSMVRSTGVMLRRNGEEMDKLFGAMENLSGRYQRTVRNFYLTLFLLLMAGLLALLPMIFFGSRLIRRYEAEKRADAQRIGELQQGNAALVSAVSALQEETRRAAEAGREARAAERREWEAGRKQMEVWLDQARSDYQTTVDSLRREMAAEKQRADAEITRLREEEKNRLEAETAQLRREFAARQLAFEKELEAERGRTAQERERRIAAEKAAASGPATEPAPAESVPAAEPAAPGSGAAL